MRAYVTEFIGTFFLVLAIGLSVGLKQELAALAIGGTLMAMIFMGGHVSGAHYNPAVSLAVFMRGKLAAKDLVPYWIAQIAGAIAAALLVRFVFLGHYIEARPILNEALFSALLIEFLFTFALALVVLNVATAKGTSGNSFYGLAIGFTVVGGAIAGGAISKAAFNPAVGIGITLMGVPVQYIWLYLVGPLAGGAAAAAVFKIQNPEG
jgi:aquaporin Z